VFDGPWTWPIFQHFTNICKLQKIGLKGKVQSKKIEGPTDSKELPAGKFYKSRSIAKIKKLPKQRPWTLRMFILSYVLVTTH
jgi:hypothetical protein